VAGPLLSSYLQFTARSSTTGRERTIQALCGDAPPTITDGYALWNTIPRPLLRGVTVFTGYNPAAMTVSIRLGRWSRAGWATGRDPLTGQDAGNEVENDIDILGWMAGERFIEGPSPVVYVSSWNAKTQNSLVPPQYHNVPWVIANGVTWGQAWRNDAGQRIWQEATVVLTQYTALNNPPKQTDSQKGSQYVTTEKTNTLLKIAATSTVGPVPPSQQQRLAKAMKDASQNKKLKLTSIYEKIKPHTSVYVPPHHI
jgi:hypothetical protein